MSTYLNRYDEAQPHRDKGFAWGQRAMLLAIPTVALWPINVFVEDVAWSVVLACLSIVGLTVQIFALVKSVRAHRRANKIVAGAR